MNKIVGFSLLIGVCVPLYAQDALQCNVGPAIMRIADGDWGVFSCSDGDTVVLYTVKGNPAAEFYFMFYKKNGVYQLYGEGNGNKDSSQKAKDILGTYNDVKIKDLIAQTKKSMIH